MAKRANQEGEEHVLTFVQKPEPRLITTINRSTWAPSNIGGKEARSGICAHAHLFRTLSGTSPPPSPPFNLDTQPFLKVAKRLDQGHARMLRLRPDGSKLTWSVATMSRFQKAGRTPKPFFITWDDPTMRPDKVRPLIFEPQPSNALFRGPPKVYKHLSQCGLTRS